MWRPRGGGFPSMQGFEVVWMVEREIHRVQAVGAIKSFAIP